MYHCIRHNNNVIPSSQDFKTGYNQSDTRNGDRDTVRLRGPGIVIDRGGDLIGDWKRASLKICMRHAFLWDGFIRSVLHVMQANLIFI
jgi:hypothetical protein